MSTVEEVWHALRIEARGEAGWHVRRIHAAASCEILAGLLRPAMIPGLLIELSIDDVPSGLSLPQSRGFSVDPSIVQPGPSGRVRFALSLADSAYETVFSVLCEDAAATAASASDARNALRAWVGRLHVWQEFMSRHGAGGLSEEAAIGLYGELWILRERLMPTLGQRAAMDAWAGPRGEPNDFALAGGFLEVKSTTHQAPEIIPISSVEQLDDRRGMIVLTHLQLRNDAKGEDLARLVSTLRASLTKCSGEQLQRFNDLLLACGYLDARSEVYARPWVVWRVTFYRVTDDFPRVRRDDLRTGVRTCRYTVTTSACDPYTVSEQVLAELMQSPQS